MPPLLRLNNICKYYGDLAANKDINLDINEGVIHAVVGENGAGKSTLMNILSGVVKPSNGFIELRGNKLLLKNPNDATRAGIGMVQQEFMLFNDLTVLENIIIGHEDVINGPFLDLKKSEKRIIEICKKYNFNIPLNRKVNTLPLAIQQQVEIVKVLFKDADVIILDEPTAVLTPQGIEGLFNAMRNLVENGKTILFISHKLKEVLEISDFITVLKDGELINTVKKTETNKNDLAKMMVGREVFLDIEKDSSARNEILYNVNNLFATDDRGQVAVNGVSFDIKYGEILGIVGIAGNGQNELVESLVGLRKIDSGKIIYKQKNTTKNTPKDNRLEKIGYVPQNRQTIGSSLTSTLVENVMLGKHLSSFISNGLVNYNEAEAFTSDVLTTFDVKNQSLHDETHSLSGGNLQKLIVGREFSQENELLIVEDPTRGIDIGSMEFIWNEILKKAQQGNGCLLITYDLNEAIQLSDRIIVMFEGEIVKEFNRSEFNEQEIGKYMLGGRVNEAY